MRMHNFKSYEFYEELKCEHLIEKEIETQEFLMSLDSDSLKAVKNDEPLTNTPRFNYEEARKECKSIRKEERKRILATIEKRNEKTFSSIPGDRDVYIGRTPKKSILPDEGIYVIFYKELNNEH